MPRLNVVNPDQAQGKAKEIFDGPLKQKRLNIFKGIANNPGVLDAFLKFSGGVKGAGALSAAEHEVIALRVGQTNDCEYCLAAHTKVAAGAGIDGEEAKKIRAGNSDDEKTQALIDFTDAVLEKKGFVSDAELEKFKNAGYDEAAVVEVIGAVAVNTFTNLFNHVNETDIDPVFEKAPALA